MTRHSPTTETRTVLRTILSAGVLVVLLVLMCLGTAAAACPNDENMGTVNFRGGVTGKPIIDLIGVDGVNVRVDEILSDPTGNLSIGDVVTVGYPTVPPFADIDATVGDLVEVCGEYCGVEEPQDWSGVGDHMVWLHAPDHFYMKLDTVNFRGVVTGEPVIDATGAGGVNVRIDEILSDPTGNLTIGEVVTVGYPIVPPFVYISVAVGDRVEVCGEYRDIEEIPDWWSGVGEHWVWLHEADHFCRLLSPTAAASSATGTPRDSYPDNEDIYVTGTGFPSGTDVHIFVVVDRDWNDGDPIPSQGVVAVSDGTVSTSGDVGPVLVWQEPLVSGEYDIVIDANQNDIYDIAIDGLDSGSPGFVVTSAKPVPALTSIEVIVLVGLLCVIGVIRIRRRFE